MLLGNEIEFLDVWFGSSIAGTVSVPLNTALRGDVLKHQLELAAPVVAVVDAELLDEIGTTVAGIASISELVVVGKPSGSPSTVPYERWLSETGMPAPAAAAPWDLTSIMFTSGTTGPSKGVMYAHNTGLSMVDSVQWVLDYGVDDVSYTCLPLFHANVLFVSMLPALRVGGSVVIAPRFRCRGSSSTSDASTPRSPASWARWRRCCGVSLPIHVTVRTACGGRCAPRTPRTSKDFIGASEWRPVSATGSPT